MQTNRFTFMLLMSSLMAMSALCMDMMLPALPNIMASLNKQQGNEQQQIISLLFFGVAAGVLFGGGLSDRFGRKNLIYWSVIPFMLGTPFVLLTDNIFWVLCGRLLQGVSLGIIRAVVFAMIRDKFGGSDMAKVSAYVLSMFILVTMIAPLIGQKLLYVMNWQGLFVLVAILMLMSVIWLALKQPETLLPKYRNNSVFSSLWLCTKTLMRNRFALSITIASGVMNGVHLTYILISEQLLVGQYSVGSEFGWWFALLSLPIAFAAFVNGKLLKYYSVWNVSGVAVLLFLLASASCSVWMLIYKAELSFIGLIVYLSIMMFCSGITTGNFTAFAMEPMGQMAGAASSLINSIASLVSFFIGWAIGNQYNQSMLAISLGFLICACFVIAGLIIARRSVHFITGIPYAS